MPKGNNPDKYFSSPKQDTSNMGKSKSKGKSPVVQPAKKGKRGK